MYRRWLVPFALACTSLLQFNCSGCGGGSNDEDINFIPEDDIRSANASYNPDAMNEIIASFSSPVEMAAMLEDSGVPFSRSYLVDPEKTKEYTSNFKKALGLGVLSTDLGYLNVYQKTGQIIEYLANIRNLTEELKLGQFFDFATLKRLATSDDNIDTLQFMCTQSYHNMDAHLRENQRSNLSALLVTGVWLESLYLLTQVEKEQHSEDLKNAIGNQKGILNTLLPILINFREQDHFEELVQNLEELKDVLDVVKVSVQVKEIPSVNNPGTMVQQEFTVIEISDEELHEIISVTEKIRNKIIN